jgi:hypothetical protein
VDLVGRRARHAGRIEQHLIGLKKTVFFDVSFLFFTEYRRRGIFLEGNRISATMGEVADEIGRSYDPISRDVAQENHDAELLRRRLVTRFGKSL